jgi:hypothetical protein
MTTTQRPPTRDFSRGLNQYSLDYLHSMLAGYRAEIDRGEADEWTHGRIDALVKEINRRG